MHSLTCLVFLKLQLFNYGPFSTKGFIVPPAGLNLSKIGDLTDLLPTSPIGDGKIIHCKCQRRL